LKKINSTFIFKSFLKTLLNKSFLGMNPPSPDRTRGKLLRSLREAQGIDLSDLARQVSLSVGQLQQLESDDIQPGKRSMFYTATIQDKAAMKVAKALGADPQMLFEAPHSPSDPDVAVLPDSHILEDLVVLLNKHAPAREVGKGKQSFSWKWGVGALGALWLTGAVGYYGPSVSTWVDAHKSLAIPVAPAYALVSVPPIPDMSLSVTAVNSASKKSRVVQHSSPTSAEALCDNQAPQTTLSASRPSKSGGSVHVVALADLVMCARDGSGKSMPVSLKAQESRTLWGKAPWSLRIEKPVPMHMFFQGQKIYWPEGDVSGVILKEVAGNY
jgi:cytoskeletal protein RodZ